MSEISTVVLCLLSPFEVIDGMPDAFPTVYQALKVIFALLFTFVRVLVWPMVSLANSRDSYRGIKYCHERKQPMWHLPYFMLFLTSVTALTILQVQWALMIFFKARETILKWIGPLIVE